MTDTPRTDERDMTGVVMSDFARTLERELNAANARIAELDARIEEYEHALGLPVGEPHEKILATIKSEYLRGFRDARERAASACYGHYQIGCNSDEAVGVVQRTRDAIEERIRALSPDDSLKGGEEGK